MTMHEKPYECHIQLVLAALKSASDRSVHVNKIQLVDLSLPADTPWRKLDTQFLTILLTELMEYARSLRLLRSNSALALLSHVDINIRELDFMFDPYDASLCGGISSNKRQVTIISRYS